MKTFLCGLLVTAVTLLVMPSERILFGILHFLGAAMMLLGLCEPLLRKIPAAAGVLFSAVLYLATDSIGQGWIGLGPLRLELPRALYDAGFLFPLGLHPLIFASADYYPLLPWIFLFLAATGWARPFSSGVPRSSATRNTSRRWAGSDGMPSSSTWCINRWYMACCGSPTGFSDKTPTSVPLGQEWGFARYSLHIPGLYSPLCGKFPVENICAGAQKSPSVPLIGDGRASCSVYSGKGDQPF